MSFPKVFVEIDLMVLEKMEMERVYRRTAGQTDGWREDDQKAYSSFLNS